LYSDSFLERGSNKVCKGLCGFIVFTVKRRLYVSPEATALCLPNMLNLLQRWVFSHFLNHLFTFSYNFDIYREPWLSSIQWTLFQDSCGSVSSMSQLCIEIKVFWCSDLISLNLGQYFTSTLICELQLRNLIWILSIRRVVFEKLEWLAQSMKLYLIWRPDQALVHFVL